MQPSPTPEQESYTDFLHLHLRSESDFLRSVILQLDGILGDTSGPSTGETIAIETLTDLFLYARDKGRPEPPRVCRRLGYVSAASVA